MKELYRQSFIFRLILLPLSLLFTILDIILVSIVFLIGDIDELFVGTSRLKVNFLEATTTEIKIKQEKEKENE